MECNKNTLAELRNIAREKGITGFSRMNKEDLLKKIYNISNIDSKNFEGESFAQMENSNTCFEGSFPNEIAWSPNASYLVSKYCLPSKCLSKDNKIIFGKRLVR